MVGQCNGLLLTLPSIWGIAGRVDVTMSTEVPKVLYPIGVLCYNTTIMATVWIMAHFVVIDPSSRGPVQL